MAKKDLSKRRIWQDYSGANATRAEHNFYDVFKNAFKNTNYEIVPKPKDFTKIYIDVKLEPETQKQIYNPTEKINKHGISPDYKIINKKNNKILFVEVKRQDGWVEGKPRSAGRGNAHERSNKFFTPGLLKVLRKKSKINNNHLPFWTVFFGDITRDPCRVREITLWHDSYKDHYYMWRDATNAEGVLNHFFIKLKKLLD
jgi:hypothetical protein